MISVRNDERGKRVWQWVELQGTWLLVARVGDPAGLLQSADGFPHVFRLQWSLLAQVLPGLQRCLHNLPHVHFSDPCQSYHRVLWDWPPTHSLQGKK